MIQAIAARLTSLPHFLRSLLGLALAPIIGGAMVFGAARVSRT